MADNADAGAHPPPLRTARSAVHRVAALTGLAKGQVAKGLEDRHGRNRTGMAFIADVGLDPDQHGRLSLMSRVTVKACELLCLTFKSYAGVKRMLVMGIDGFAAEQCLTVVTLAAVGVLLCFGKLCDLDRNHRRVRNMRSKSGMTGATLAQFRNRDSSHALLAAVTIFLPRPILPGMATLAYCSSRNTICRPVGLDSLELPGSGAPCNRCKDQQNKNDFFHGKLLFRDSVIVHTAILYHSAEKLASTLRQLSSTAHVRTDEDLPDFFRS